MTDKNKSNRGEPNPNNGRVDKHKDEEPTIYRSFRCPRCKTDISVSKKEIGTPIVCPDCDTSLVVPDYLDFTATDAERRRAARSNEETARRAELVSSIKNPNREGIDFAKENVYSVDNGKNDALRKKFSRENMFPVRCGVCRALLYATRDELGTAILCSDCGTKTVATDSLRKQFDFEAKQNFATAPEASLGEYVVEEPKPILTDLTYRRFLRTSDRRKKDRTKKKGKKERRPDEFLPLVLRRRGDNFVWTLAPPPKKFPMFNGVFRTLATEELWARGGIVGLMAAGIAVLLASTILPAVKIYRENVFPKNPLWELEVLAACAVLVPLLGAFWAFASTYYTSIFATGNSGARRAVEWRDEDLIGYVAFGGWSFLLVAAALAPGMLAAAFVGSWRGAEITEIGPANAEIVANWANWLEAALPAGTFWLLFPIFWLSTLLEDAFFVPFSSTLFASFWRRGRAWIQFYLASALVLGVPLTLFFRYIETEKSWTFFPFALLSAPILYALLLGRLSWILDDDLRSDDYDD